LLFDNQGLSHYTSYLALGLSKYHDVIFYSFSQNYFVITGANKEKKIEHYSLEEKLPKGNSILKILGRSLILFYILARELTTRRYDIVHIQERLPTFFLFFPLLKLRRKRVVWTVHDIRLLPLSNGIRGKMEVIYRCIISQPYFLAKYSDIIIVHSQSLKQQLVGRNIKQNKIHVIPHFDYGYLLKRDGNVEALPNHDKKDTGYVLFFGDITPWKGIETLINAVKIVKTKVGNDFKLVIAGRSYHGYVNTKNIVEKYGDFIKVIDKFITESEIPALFQNSSFLVLPYNNSFQYSVSGVIPLAYTFSKPVVVSNVPSIVEYVDNNETGLIFESGNYIQLANCIVDLILNKDKCNTMGHRAYQKVMNEMSLESCCAKLHELYCLA